MQHLIEKAKKRKEQEAAQTLDPEKKEQLLLKVDVVSNLTIKSSLLLTFISVHSFQ
jgi:hypothetical protein